MNNTNQAIAGKIIMAFALLLIASLALATIARAEDDGNESGTNDSRESEDHEYAPQESGNTTGTPERSGEREDNEQENRSEHGNTSEHEDSEWRFDDDFKERPPKVPPVIPPIEINDTDYNYSDYNVTDTYNYTDYNFTDDDDIGLNESDTDSIYSKVSTELDTPPLVINQKSNTPTVTQETTPPPKHERSWFAMFLSWLGLA
jgi:hypothetical protein